MGNDSFQSWMRSTASAAMRHCRNIDGIYYGQEGCKRFARECGCAIPDFTLNRDEQNELIQSTYSCICVIAYNLKPPVDANIWFKFIREGRDKAMRIRAKNMEDAV